MRGILARAFVTAVALAALFAETVPAKVLSRSPMAGKARASALLEKVYTTPSGLGVRVALSPNISTRVDLAQDYADFLDTLEHGPELEQLSVYIAPPDEIGGLCGAEAMACYSPGEMRMYIPSEEIEAATGLSTAYVVAHEYGHHLAAFRSHAPFRALHYGPKRWASRQRVCAGVRRGMLAPGDEAQRYQENPGEAWAETYAQLRFPGVRWFFADSLAPDRGALAAARADVLDPWTGEQTSVLSGRLRGKRRARVFTVPVTLDGAFSVTLDGPGRAQFDLGLAVGGRPVARTRARGADDTLAVAALCRRSVRDKVELTVVRRSGAGAFSLAVRYAG